MFLAHRPAHESWNCSLEVRMEKNAKIYCGKCYVLVHPDEKPVQIDGVWYHHYHNPKRQRRPLATVGPATVARATAPVRFPVQPRGIRIGLLFQ